MHEEHIDARKIVNERLFSADGSNILFEHINNVLKSKKLVDNFKITVDFNDIDLVSTSFVGRFQEQVLMFKKKHPNCQLKIINIRPEIKRQFTKSESQ